MADGGTVLKIDADLARRLRSAAEAVGEPFEEFARHALEVAAHDDPSWEEDFRRLAEYDRTGIAYPAEDVLKWLEQAVATRFDKRK